MILLYGLTDDEPMARTLEALQEAGASYVLLSQTALHTAALRIETGTHGVSGSLQNAGQMIALEQIHSVYARPLELPARAFDPAGAARARAFHEHFFEWLDVSPALVVNPPRAMQANSSKPLQAQLIGAAGFAVPQTLVTNSEEEARAFWHEHGRVVFKSTSGIRSIVKELDERSAARLPLLSALPTQFQAWVPGLDVRVHVVGNRAFAASIESSVVDYRYAAREGGVAELTATDLPDEIAARCIALAAQMELPLAGIDLRRRPDGEYVCLEVNPMPAYSFFQAHTGLPISQAIAELLIRGRVPGGAGGAEAPGEAGRAGAAGSAGGAERAKPEGRT